MSVSDCLLQIIYFLSVSLRFFLEPTTARRVCDVHANLHSRLCTCWVQHHISLSCVLFLIMFSSLAILSPPAPILLLIVVMVLGSSAEQVPGGGS